MTGNGNHFYFATILHPWVQHIYLPLPKINANSTDLTRFRNIFISFEQHAYKAHIVTCITILGDT